MAIWTNERRDPWSRRESGGKMVRRLRSTSTPTRFSERRRHPWWELPEFALQADDRHAPQRAKHLATPAHLTRSADRCLVLQQPARRSRGSSLPTTPTSSGSPIFCGRRPEG